MAVYTPIALAEATALARAHDPSLTIRSMAGAPHGVENTIFFLEADNGRVYVLTIYEQRTEAEDLPFFLGLMNHLRARGVRCPEVLPLDGALFAWLRGKPTSLTTFLLGASPEKPLPRHCAQAGEALARLHRAGADYPHGRANALGIEAWEGMAARCLDAADQEYPQVATAIREELDFLPKAWPRDTLPQGVIHADYFPDNVLFADAAPLGIIDFCFSCRDIVIYDLAICLNAWCFESDGAFNITKARALANAYHAHRPLTREERMALPTLCRGAALRFLLTRLYDVLYPQPGRVRAKPPLDYWARLIFHRQARSAASYGLDV